MSFIDENGIIPSLQSFYRSHPSTNSAMCKIHSDLVLIVFDDKPCILVLLDLSAAFDTTDHTILREDVQVIGICCSAFAVIKSYLLDHFQK